MLSVRGEASRLVDADDAVLSARVAVAHSTTADALRAVAVAVDALVADLAGVGGQPLSAGTARASLTWSRYSVSTSDEWDRAGGATGRMIAAVEVSVVVRALGELDAVSALLARHEELQLQGVQWRVDDDNPAWPDVRADAVAAALRKGRDYAAALGGELLQVEHLAEVGLPGPGEARAAHALFTSAASGEPEAPSLDPVPQVLSAAVEARFTASSQRL